MNHKFTIAQPCSYREEKTIVDGKEVDAPFNENCINTLSPAIAEALLQIYDEEMVIGEEDEKK